MTTILHNASLMYASRNKSFVLCNFMLTIYRLDDFEDGSQLRRGRSSTHTVFGAGQTVNAANYQIIRALEEVQKFGDAESLIVFTGSYFLYRSWVHANFLNSSEELKNLYVGQSMDLYWTANMVCPTVNEYFKMIEHSKSCPRELSDTRTATNRATETGGLFRLFGRLMVIHSTSPVKPDLDKLLNQFGRYFQTRDDYQNLVSPEVCLRCPSLPTSGLKLTWCSIQSKKASARIWMKENSPCPSFISCPLHPQTTCSATCGHSGASTVTAAWRIRLQSST